MAVDVSRIPNNNKFDPVREAILQLQTDIEDTGNTIGNGTLTIGTSGTLSGSGTFTANQSSNTTITIGIDDSDYLSLSDTGEQTISGDIIISGDLTVSGATITKLSEEVLIEDNIIVLNSNEDGTPSLDAGIEIERGTATNVDFLWNETDNRWDLKSSGSGAGLKVYNDGIGSTTLTIAAGGTAGDAVLALTPNTGTGGVIKTTNEKDLVFQPNSTTKMVIASGGDVNIYNSLAVGKTGAPSYALDVTGSGYFGRSSLSQTSVLTIEQLNTVGSNQSLLIKNANDRDVGIKLETGGGSHYIWQDSNGDDALIISAGGGNRTDDATIIFGQNHSVTIPQGSLTIIDDASPSIYLQDTTNDLVLRIYAANNYVYFTADQSNTVGSTRMYFRVDGADVVYYNQNQDAFFANDVNATTFIGDVTGNVTGDVTGDLTGNVTGDVTANDVSATEGNFEDLFLTNASGASLSFRNSQGNTVDTDNLATMSFQGYYDSAYVGAARIQVKANEDFSATARGSVINFDFWDTGSTYDTVASIDSDGFYIGTTNVYDNLPDGITYSDTDNRLKIGVSKNVGSTTETAIQPILLANLLTEGYIPYVASGGAGSATVNSKVSDSWLKVTSDTLELGDSDPVSHEVRYARFLWQSGSNDKISTVYGARDITASVQYSGGSATGKIAFTTGSGGGRIRFNDEFTFPATDGTSGQVLTTNGSGDLSWAAAGGGSLDLQDVTDNGATTTNDITIQYNGLGLQVENTANNGADTGIRIRGARNGQNYATDNLTSYILFSNYDDNTTPNNYDLAKIGAGMYDASDDTGYFQIQVNDGTSLVKALDIEKNKNATFYGIVRSEYDSSHYVQLESNSSGGVVKGIGGNGFMIRSYGDTYFNGGNFGIGTTSPDLKLHVAHSDSNNGLLLEHTGQASGYQYLLNARQTEGLIFQRWANGAYSANVMTLNYSGNVGIGTTSPDRNLHVKGSTFGSMHVEGTTGDAFVEFTTANNNSFIGIDDSLNVLKINNTNTLGSAVHLAIDSSGQVGIGTTSPSHKLHVNGDIRQSKIVIRDDSIERYDSAADDGAVNFNYVGYNSTNTYFRDVNVWNGKSGLVAQFDGSANSFYVPNGSVGIGTTSPNEKLSVNGAIRTTGATTSNESSATISWNNTPNEASFESRGKDNTARGKIVLYQAYANGTNGLRVLETDSSGNVGIGTTPKAWATAGNTKALQISTRGALSEAYNGVFLSNNYYFDGTEKYIETDEACRINLLGDGDIVFENAPSGTAGSAITFEERMRIDSDGNVGIGISNPADYAFTNLVVGNTSSDGGITVVSGTSSVSRLLFADGSAAPNEYIGGVQYFHSDNSMRLYTNDDERMRIASGGNVGIGTTTPSYRLQVQKTSIAAPAFMVGGAYYGGPRIQTYGLDADSNAWMGLGTDMSGAAYEHSIYFPDYSTHGRLTFGTYNGTTYSTKATLLKNGNFGIGTTSPEYVLDVTGGARFTNNIRVGQYIYHNNDTNTYISFTSDRIRLNAGGVNMIDITEGGTDYIDFANNTARITSGGAFETTGDIIAYTTTSLSDKNQKENIKKIHSPIEKIKQINGYTFDWKHNQASSGGVIAQEVEKVLPEIVKERSIMDSEPHKTVEYNGLIGLLIETVKEQQKQIDELKARLDGSTK